MYTSRNDHCSTRHATTTDSLYRACRDIVNETDGIVTGLGAGAFQGLRLVAFWNGEKVCPGYGATKIEHEAIRDYGL